MEFSFSLFFAGVISGAAMLWLAVRVLHEYKKKRGLLKTEETANTGLQKLKAVVLIVVSILCFAAGGWVLFQLSAFQLLFPAKNFLDYPVLVIVLKAMVAALGLIAMIAGIWIFAKQVPPPKQGKFPPLFLRIIGMVTGAAVFVVGLALALFFILTKGLLPY
jgi:hypothetical protein